MKKKIVLEFEDDELAALEELSKQEFRDIEQQAAHVIRQELERRGILKTVKIVEGKTEKKFLRLDE